MSKPIDDLTVDVAEYLKLISERQRFYGWICLGLLVLALFPPTFDIRLAVVSVFIVGVCGVFAGIWFQNVMTIKQLLQHGYHEMCDAEAGYYDNQPRWYDQEDSSG